MHYKKVSNTRIYSTFWRLLCVYEYIYQGRTCYDSGMHAGFWAEVREPTRKLTSCAKGKKVVEANSESARSRTKKQ